MARETENYGLNLIDETDTADITVLNENFEVIDDELQRVSMLANTGGSATAQVDTKIGATNDTGGSTTAGSIFAKLNKLITDFTNHVGHWTANRAAKIDTIDSKANTISSTADSIKTTVTAINTTCNTVNSNLSSVRSDVSSIKSTNDLVYANSNTNKTNIDAIKTATATNNTANANGTLSQKLSHIINILTGNTVEHLASKVLNFDVNTAGTHTIMNIYGAGVFEYASTNMRNGVCTLNIEIDGVKVTLPQSVGDNTFIAQSMFYPGSTLYQVNSQTHGAADFAASMRPLHFRSNIKITVDNPNANTLYFRCHYALYE